MAGHTPGPWAVVHPADDFDYISVCAFEGDPADGIMSDVIAEVISNEDEADARLIAAAPDLLDNERKNLATLEWTAERICALGMSHVEITAAIEQTRAAIAKASPQTEETS